MRGRVGCGSRFHRGEVTDRPTGGEAGGWVRWQKQIVDVAQGGILDRVAAGAVSDWFRPRPYNTGIVRKFCCFDEPTNPLLLCLRRNQSRTFRDARRSAEHRTHCNSTLCRSQAPVSGLSMRRQVRVRIGFLYPGSGRAA